MSSWLSDKDAVFLCETFTDSVFNVPAGFRVIIGKSKSPNRGGVAFLIRNYLYKRLVNIDISTEEQIWLTFDFLPDVSFGGVYIAPTSSPYYSESDIAVIQSKCKTRNTNKNIVGGDYNSKLGSDIHRLVGERPLCSYIINHEVPKKSDKSGLILSDVCVDVDILPLNNLKFKDKHFRGDYSYREGKRWLSEVDMCLVSRTVLPAVSHFNIDQNPHFPSDHAPVNVIFDCDILKSHTYTCASNSESLLARASMLGAHNDPKKNSQAQLKGPPDMPDVRKQVKSSNVNRNQFVESVISSTPPDFTEHVDIVSNNFSEVLYNAAKSNTHRRNRHTEPLISMNPRLNHGDSDTPEISNSERDRWQRIIKCNDDNLLWKAVNWKGEVDFQQESDEKPSDEQFKAHFEQLLFPIGEKPLDIAEIIPDDYDTTIPILDAEIDVSEVSDVIFKQVKPNKSCGPDGVSPGLFRWLPAQWIIFLTMLLNMAFVCSYPAGWMYAKLIMLFKKGSRTVCDNYRGISIINSIAKIYDYVLYNRLTKWWQPDREQAGAQAGRGCAEHLVTLRLLMEFSLRKRKKLFIAFIDFTKAYDKVPRKMLFLILKKLGCGVVMLAALISMYKITHSILGIAVISAVIGVRQGSPTSCFLFILYVNVLIRNIKLKSGPDSFLEWLHVLMLMDDTVVFASTRERLIDKLNILDEYCITHGMSMNESKTKFMVIRGSASDCMPIQLTFITVKLCNEYLYLGNIYTADGSSASSLRAQARDKRKQLNKLFIFLRVNKDMPFAVKRKVVEACFNSALLYGCESWLKVNLKPVESMYIAAVKALLNVRHSIPSEICLIEAGMLPLSALVKKRQYCFFTQMNATRSGVADDPLMFMIERIRQSHPALNNYLDSVSTYSELYEREHLLERKIRDCNQGQTRFLTYVNINPNLTMHSVYDKRLRGDFIPEHYRIAFTRMRTSSHRLRVETGRWSRIDRERRVCKCGEGIGDEEHVLTRCKLTQHLRDGLGRDVVYPDFIEYALEEKEFKFIYEVLKIYD